MGVKLGLSHLGEEGVWERRAEGNIYTQKAGSGIMRNYITCTIYQTESARMGEIRKYIQNSGQKT